MTDQRNDQTPLLQIQGSSHPNSQPRSYLATVRQAGLIATEGLWWTITIICAFIFSALASKNSSSAGIARLSAMSSWTLNMFDGICFGREASERLHQSLQARRSAYYAWYLACFLPGIGLIVFNAIVGWDLAATSIQEIHQNSTLPELRALNLWATTQAGQTFGQLANALMLGASATVSWQAIAYNSGLSLSWSIRAHFSKHFRALRDFKNDLNRLGPALQEKMRYDDSNSLPDFITAFYKTAIQEGYYQAGKKSVLSQIPGMLFTATRFLCALFAFFEFAWPMLMITEEGLESAKIPNSMLNVLSGFITPGVYIFFVVFALPTMLFDFYRLTYHLWGKMSYLPEGASLKHLLSSKLFNILLSAVLIPFAWFSGSDWSFITKSKGALLANLTLSEAQYPSTLDMVQGNNPIGLLYREIPLTVAAYLMLIFTMCGNLYGVYGQFIHTMQKHMQSLYPNNPVTKYTQQLEEYFESKGSLRANPDDLLTAMEHATGHSYETTCLERLWHSGNENTPSVETGPEEMGYFAESSV